MIISNLNLINTLLALIGIIGWGWVWWFSKYKTGCNARVQLGMISLGVVWVFLFLADTTQDFNPTTLTVVSRALILVGLWCCMPLLKIEDDFMAVIDMQKELGVLPDGWWGDKTHKVFLASGRDLDFNWAYLRRKLSSTFTQEQVDGLNYILDACNRERLSPQHAAYILATCWHETAFKMKPIDEIGKGRGKRYGTWFTNSKGEKYGIRNGAKHKPAYLQSDYNHLYYGRGFPQLTWLDNYIKAGIELGVDFANNPELASKPEHSADIMVKGSMQGWFTGKSIPDRIKFGTWNEFVSARGVINGKDRAADIAKYAKIFFTSLDLKRK